MAAEPLRPLTLLLTADCCNGPLAEHGDRQRWQAIFDQAASLQRLIRRVTAEAGRVTWFVRADNQIGATLGDTLACFEEWLPLLMAWEQAGDAIGFHPHCYRLCEGRWEAQTDDVANAAMLLAAGRRLATLPLQVSVSRIGEAHMTPLLMATLRDLGFTADCTALPGRRRTDPPAHDWSRIPRAPYQPAPDDYQQPGATDPAALWEIPFSMLPVQGPTDDAPRERYLNLGFLPECLQPAMEAWLPTQDLLIALMHPVETLDVPPEVAETFPLVAFAAEAVVNNLLFIMEYCRLTGRPLIWLTMPQLVERLRDGVESSVIA